MIKAKLHGAKKQGGNDMKSAPEVTELLVSLIFHISFHTIQDTAFSLHRGLKQGIENKAAASHCNVFPLFQHFTAEIF